MTNTILTIKNNYIVLSSEDDDLLDGVYSALSFKDTSKAFMYGKFDADRIITVRFAKPIKDLEPPSLKISIGFLEFIQSVLVDFEHSVLDDRKELENIDTSTVSLKNIELHDHQLKAVSVALSKRRGIIAAPTGAGKSEIFLAMLSLLKEPSLVLFNRTQLAQQTLKRAADRGLDSGIVQGKNLSEKDITMATIQSIDKIEKIKKYKNLLLDEAQNLSSKSYQRILKLSHWERVYGFSATPVNPNKMDLKSAKIIANVGPVILDIKAEEMMEKGIIAKPKIYMIPINLPDNINEFNYKQAEMVGIIYNKHRNNIVKILAEKHKENKVLILTKYIDQGREIQKLLPGAPFVWNEVKVKDRIKIVDKFDNGDTDILIASRILDEGIDIKNFKTLIIASAGLSFVKTIQRLGRGLRVTETKKDIIVYDFIDKIHRSLNNHSKQRIKDYKAFGYNDIIKLKEDSNELHLLLSQL